jgi:hypothetical protein
VNISVYTSQRMTGRMCDEMLEEANMLMYVLESRGMQILNPVLEENPPNLHVLLENVPQERLEHFWKRDKEMIRDSDVLLDYMTMNKSDGSNKEVGYNRFCLWKPTVRVWNGAGGFISRIEDDIVVPTLEEALDIIEEKWSTYTKLGEWRKKMLFKSFPKWLAYQERLLERYGLPADTIANTIQLKEIQ